MTATIERFFQVRERGSSVRRECLAGATTFLTMAYILFVQPIVLAKTGMDHDAVLIATAVGSAFATLVMAFYANYPIALAPAMGHNFFFAYTVCLAMKIPWEVALGANFISSVLFVVLATMKFRERVMDAIPSSLKHAIAAGIGLFIAFIGLEWSGIVVDKPGTLVGLGALKMPAALLALTGLAITAVLYARKVRSAILLGMLATLAIGVACGQVKFHGIIGVPHPQHSTILQLNPLGALKLGFGSVVFTFFLLAVFDTVGTLIGVAQQGGFMRNGRMPNAGRALLSDAAGTVAGTLLGTSTITAYIESAAGVSAGARTGLASVITAALFLLALAFAPLIAMVGAGVTVGEATLYPVTAPALIVVGFLMTKNILFIPWREPTEALPAFLTLIGIPLAFSIVDGIALGFIGYVIMKTFTGKRREISWVSLAIAAAFVIHFAL
ncbi:MAG: NCS2 family permease [Verrucomicrobia bacterium]|nr:NCS2 family permease [Verrucomicrobiota bacterium]